MEVSEQARNMIEDSNADLEGNNSNALLWILGDVGFGGSFVLLQ